MSEGQNQRPLNFKIWNNTWNTTLKLYKFKGDQMSPDFKPELPPGSSDSCQIFSNPDMQVYCWLLVYEAESFTLAFTAYVPSKSRESPNMLHVELSLDKAHLGDFEESLSCLIWQRNPPNSDKTTMVQSVFEKKPAFLELRAGPYSAKVFMNDECVKVRLEEREEPRIFRENP